MRYRLLALAALLLVGCADLNTTPPRTPSEIRLTHDTIVVTEGDVPDVAVALLDQAGAPYDPIPAWAAPRWTSSAPAVLDAQATHLLALAPGEARATVSIAGLSRTATVRVNPAVLGFWIAHVVADQENNDGQALWPGRPARVRIHLGADRVNFFRPVVRVTVLHNGVAVHTLEAEPGNAFIPLASAPTDDAAAWRAELPGDLVQPGLSLVVEADPANLVPAATGSHKRYPDVGTHAIAVRQQEILLNVRGVHLTQGVQRADGSVPLIAGRPALLRVFMTADAPNDQQPQVRVSLYDGDELIDRIPALQAADSVPQVVREGDFSLSWNAGIDAAQLRPGISIVVEADPEHSIMLKPGSRPRYPETGRLALDVREVAPFGARMIPVRQSAFGTTGDVNESNLWQRYLKPLIGMFPLAAYSVEVRATYTTNARLDTDAGWYELIDEIGALRTIEGSNRYYYGVVANTGHATIAGLGYIGWPVAIGYDHPIAAGETYAHEVGHNFGRQHVACGNPANPDAGFPHAGGSIGAWGYDIYSNESKDPATERDLMGYCRPRWISDYTYEAVLAFRDAEARTRAAAGTVREPALLVWGGVRRGRLVLEPAFELDMPPRLPAGDGPYRIAGYDAAGSRLFSYAFHAPAIGHAPDDRGFSFAIPARLAHTDRLARLELTGPEGTVIRAAAPAVAAMPSLSLERRAGAATIGWDVARYPMALVRDAHTGQVLSLARAGAAQLPAAGADLDVLLSDGVRTRRPTVQPR